MIVSCKICKQKFSVKPSHKKMGFGKYCSPTCQHKGARSGKEIPCFTCKKKTYKQKRVILRSKSGKFFCGKSCQTKWRNTEFIQERHGNWKGGKYAYRSVLLRHNIPLICRLCKEKDRRILAVHHIDKNRSNNKVANLLWLCHNCHHLVHSYPDEQRKLMVLIV